MSTYTPVRGWTEPLSHLSLGVSMASFILVPPAGTVATLSGHQPIHQDIDIVTTLPDGAFAVHHLHTIHIRTLYGLRTIHSLPMLQTNAKIESDSMPRILRDIAGLPVEILASLVGVSRNAYYKWLDGGGVSDEHLTRLSELLDVFRTLQNLLGSDLRHFLETSGPAGRPIDLLKTGDRSAVIGLALRSPSQPGATSNVSDVARDMSGLPGWLRPTTRLHWGAPRLTDVERDEALDRLSPRPLSNETEPLNPIDDDDEAFVAWGFFLE